MSKPFTLDRVVRLLIACLLAACLLWLINVLKDVLLPFCLACLIAYILEPLVEFNRSLLRLKGRAGAIFITLSEVTLLFGVICYFCVPSIEKEIHQMSEMVSRARANDQSVTVPFVPHEVHDFIRNNVNFDQLGDWLSGEHLATIVSKGTTIVSTSIGYLIHLLEWLLTFIYVVFILVDYEKLMHGFRELVPPKYRKVAYRLSDDIKESMNRYFRGQATIALCAAVLYCIGFSIVGIPLAIVLGVLVGILYMIPYFQYVTLIPVAIVCYVASMDGTEAFWPEIGKCVLVYVVSQCICDYILTPKILGKAMGLNPAIILLSLSVWGTLLGLIGMIIALPLTTLCLSYYEQYIINGGKAPAKGLLSN